MKRLFVVASLAIMAVGCQKTTVENEVLTQIGFNTEVGKQTRTIVDNQYDNAESFGVYAIAYQSGTKLNIVMPDETIARRVTSPDGAETPTYAWKATSPYYWPNDANTTLNFYAYSPKSIQAKMEVEGTLTLTAYEHKQENINTLDFMAATPVTGATFAKPDGKTVAASDADKGKVPVVFNHQMTQVLFTVNANVGTDITVTLNSIKLNHVTNKADYSSNLTNNVIANWSSKGTGSYTIYPVGTQVAKPIPTDGITSTAATMIPQTLNATVKTGETISTQGQQFEVEYTIGGTGVAHETVTKKIDLKAGTVVEWAPNRKIIYNLTVGLNEITFEPTVVGWDDDQNPETTDGPIISGNISIN